MNLCNPLETVDLSLRLNSSTVILSQNIGGIMDEANWIFLNRSQVTDAVALTSGSTDPSRTSSPALSAGSSA